MDRVQHDLCDPIAGLDGESVRGVGVEQGDGDFPSVSSVDGAWGVEDGDAVAGRQARARQHVRRVAVGQRERDSSANRGSRSRP